MSEAASPNIHEGGCLCGAIRYRVTGALSNVAHCHCSMCRKASGAAFVTWAVVAIDDFKIIQGKPAVYRSSADSERRFCPSCGTQLTFWTSRAPDNMDITVGALDDPESGRPNRHVWTSAQISWLHADNDLPAFPEGTPKDSKLLRRPEQSD